MYSVPRNIIVRFLANSESKYGIFKSKAIDEPPLMYGIDSYFALLYAIKYFSGKKYVSVFDSPMAPDKLLLALYKNKEVKITIKYFINQ